MKSQRDIANDPARPLTIATFFLGPQHCKGPWDSAGATFKYLLRMVTLKIDTISHQKYTNMFALFCCDKLIPLIRRKIDEGMKFPDINKELLPSKEVTTCTRSL